jgi:hypothetical protein
MATYRGIESTCHAVVELLRDNYDPASFNQALAFDVLTTGGFGDAPTAGVTLFLYRILVNDGHRTPPGRRSVAGEPQHTQLPLDVHFILTAWAQDASLQQGIAGWMMRTMEDHRVLPVGLLNRRTPGVFRDDETVEIHIGDIVTEDLLHLWELLGTGTYQLSVPYVARNVRIESSRQVVLAAPVQERITDYAGVGAL